MPKFETPCMKDETVNGYRFMMYESDPYYYIEVFKDDKLVTSHVVCDCDGEYEELKKRYDK